MPTSLEESLSVFGNSNHLDHFLRYYENAVQENQETQKSFTDAPNYFAWINIAPAQVLYRIREMIYNNTGDQKAFDAAYLYILDYITSA